MLSLEDRAILDFERVWGHRGGPKDQVIETTLGLSSGAYYERLRALVLGRSADGYDALTAGRVRRLIEETIDTELAV